MVVAGSLVWLPILGLATAELLSVPMSSIDPHERLALGFQQILLCIVEPAVDEVAVQAVSITDLSSMSVSLSYNKGEYLR